MPDIRISLATSLYPRCGLAADIGTDHALLPCCLLKTNRCDRMILTDISPDALDNARLHIGRARLDSRVSFRPGDGLAPLGDDVCDCISIMGMGGRNIAKILTEGQARLRGATVLLSAHTDLHLVRGAVQDIGYHLTREEVCFMDGRYYVFFLAEPGAGTLSARQIRLGSLLFDSASPVLPDYIRRRVDVLEAKRAGLLSAAVPSREALDEVTGDLDFLKAKIDSDF